MNEKPLCSIVISSDMPKDEIESLSSAIELTSAKVQKTTSRAVGLDDIALLISIAVGIGNLTEYGIKVAKAINNWRQQAREKGIEPQGKLQHPQRPDVDLTTATDEEIEEWLSQFK